MTTEDQNIVLHAMKDIADGCRTCINKRNIILDQMCVDLNITIPDRRIDDRRSNDGANTSTDSST